MGGAIFEITGRSKGEVIRQLERKKAEASAMGLYEERRAPISYDEKDGVWRSAMKVHS